jgi:hypothetical protein
LGEVRFFRVVLRLREMRKSFELGQKNIFCFFILVFPKFNPLTASGMALCGDLGPKCQNLQNLFCLVSD